MKRRCLMLISLVAVPFLSFGQQTGNVTHVKNVPLIDGYTQIAANHNRIGGDIQIETKGIDLISQSPEVHSSSIGTVSSVTSIDGRLLVLIKSHDSMFVYNGLNNSTIKAGDKIEKGQEIGKLKQDPETREHTLNWQVWLTSKGKPSALSQDILIDCLARLDK